MPRNDGIASGEPMGRKPGGRDQAGVGAVENAAPVGVQGRYALHVDSICRTDVYVTRWYGGVGGGSCEATPYPECAPRLDDVPLHIPGRGRKCKKLVEPGPFGP